MNHVLKNQNIINHVINTLFVNHDSHIIQTNLVKNHVLIKSDENESSVKESHV